MALNGNRCGAQKTKYSVAEARQGLADVREETARELAELQAQLNERISEAERADVKAYNAAISAGWTPEELKKIGFTEPEKKARTRRRNARKTTSKAAASAAAGNSAPTGAENHAGQD